jgi:hypothetical protein
LRDRAALGALLWPTRVTAVDVGDEPSCCGSPVGAYLEAHQQSRRDKSDRDT